MPLILPNTIANEQDADGDKLQQNYAALQSWANQEAITRDGSTGMVNQLLLPGNPTEPHQAADKAYVDATVGTAAGNANTAIAAGDAAALASANAHSDAIHQDMRARQPQAWSASNANAFSLAPNVWTDFFPGPNWTSAYTAQHLVTVSAMLQCATGAVYLNFGVDGGAYVSPVSAQAECVNGEAMWLTLTYAITLPAGNHALKVGGNTSGSGGSIRSFVTNVMSLFTA